MTTNYQMIFNQTFASIDPETAGAYSQLVRSLEAALEAAGYHITAAELAGAQHNYIVGAIGKTDLADIATHFIGWVHIGSDPYQEWQTRQDTYAHYRLHTLRRSPFIASATLREWNKQIRTVRLKAGIKGRTSRKYTAFLQKHAQPETYRKLLTAAQQAIDDREQQLAQLLKEMKANLHHQIEPARRAALYQRRTAHIIDALRLVSGAADPEQKADILREKAARMTAAVKQLQQNLDELSQPPTAPPPDAADIIERSLEPHQDKLKDLANLWAACKEAGINDESPVESG